jgi:hypothetical protein
LTPYFRAAALSSPGAEAEGMNGWPRVGPSDTSTGIAASRSYMLNLSILGDENIRLSPAFITRSAGYPQSEQIRYSMGFGELRVSRVGPVMQKNLINGITNIR